jgi:hypothetical protein
VLNLIAKLGLNSSGFDEGLSKAEHKASQFGRSLGSRLAGFIGVAAVGAQARATIEYAGRINDLSTAAGVSAEALQEMDYAAKQNGASIEDMVKAMRNLAGARDAALKDPGGKEAQSFKSFGIGQDFLKSTTDPAALFRKLSDAVKGTAVDLNSLPEILDLIGSKNQALIPLMQAGFSEAAEEARKLGLVIENDVIGELDELGDSIDRNMSRFNAAVAKAIGWFSKGTAGIGHMMGFAMERFNETSTPGLLGWTPYGLIRKAIAGGKGVWEGAMDLATSELANEESPAQRAKRIVETPEIRAVREAAQPPEWKEPEAIRRGAGGPENLDSLAAIGGFTAQGETMVIQTAIRDATVRTARAVEAIEREGL